MGCFSVAQSYSAKASPPKSCDREDGGRRTSDVTGFPFAVRHHPSTQPPTRANSSYQATNR